MKSMKKVISLLLTLVMVLTLVPFTVFGAEGTNDFMRIFHLDCGRKYFSVSEIEGMIDQLAANNYTHIELAFGNEGLRFLLDDMSVGEHSDDDVTNAVKAGNTAFYNAGTKELTQSEMDTIIDYAKDKNIGIIPMMNIPGHMHALVCAMGTLGMSVNYSVPTTSGTSANYAINTTDTAAISFAKELVCKYVDYFAAKGCLYFNIASDECGFDSMNSAQYAGYVSIVNDMDDYIVGKGMTTMMFNDAFRSSFAYSDIHSDIVVCYWQVQNGWLTAQNVANAGHKVINTNNKWYYVAGTEGSGWFGYQWAVDNMGGSYKDCRVCDSGYTTNTGCMAAFWCDTPSASVNTSNLYNYISTLANKNTSYFTVDKPVLWGEEQTTEPVVDPEPTVGTVTDSDTGISVTAEGLTSVSVNEVVPPAFIQYAEDAVTYDIQPYTAEGEYHGSAEVSMPIPATWDESRVHVFDENAQEISCTVAEGAVTFTAPHFSDYTAALLAESAPVNITVGIGETKTETISGNNYAGTYTPNPAGFATVTVTGQDKVDATKVETTVSSVSNNGKYYIKNSSGQYLNASAKFVNSITNAVEWTWDGTYLKNGNNYLRYSNNAWTTNTNNRTQLYFNNGTFYRTRNWSLSGYTYSNPLGQPVTLTTTEGTPASTTITFTGVKAGTTSVKIGDTTYNITVTKAAKNINIATGSTTESYTDTSAATAVCSYTDVVKVIRNNNTLSFMGLKAGTATVTTDNCVYTITVKDFTVENSIVLPITIIDYRADGYLFEYANNKVGTAYGLLHKLYDNSGTTANIAGTTIYDKDHKYAANGAAEVKILGGEYTTNHTRAGLVESKLSANGNPVYTDAAVQFVAKAIAAGYASYSDVENTSSYFSDNYNDAIRNKLTGLKNTSTNGMSATFAAEKTWANVQNAYDAAYYLLNTFYQESVEIGADGLPLYGMTTNVYDSLYLTWSDSDSAYVLDATSGIRFDRDNKAIYQDSSSTDNKVAVRRTKTETLKEAYQFYPLSTSDGYDAIYGDTTDCSGDVNGNFAMKGEAQFVYKQADNLFFEFTGDDDVYLFINDTLVLDIGGAHTPCGQRINLNDVASQCGLKDGEVASFTFFYMERHSDASNFSMKTNITLAEQSMSVEKKAYIGDVEVPDGSAVADGSTIAYDLTVTNTGEADITGLTFTDEDNWGTAINTAETYLTNQAVTNGTVTTKAVSYQYYIDDGVKTTCNSHAELVAAIKAIELKSGETLHIVFLQTTLDAVQSPDALRALNYTNTMTIKDSSGLSLSDAHSVYTFDFGDTSKHYVVDYGLPVKADNLFASGVTVTSVSLAKNGVYGQASISGNNSNATVTYTPNQVMRGIDMVTLNVKYSINGTTFSTQKTIQFIPATTVNYEEGFATFDSNWNGNASKGEGTQTTSEAHTELQAKAAIYGYDSKYQNEINASNGTQAKTTAKGATATFNFVGTGVDIFANCKTDSGKVMVLVSSGNQVVKMMVVATKAYGTYGALVGDNAFNTPIVTIKDLSYGEYKVQITSMSTETFYLDGFRVYGTLADEKNNTYYTADLEENPSYIELRDQVLGELKVTAADSEDYAEQITNGVAQVYATGAVGAVVVTNTGVTGDKGVLLDDGPKNELYLAAGQSLVFKIDTKRVVEIGMRALNGSVNVSGDYSGTISSSMDMFYQVLGKDDTRGETTVTITNNGGGILSISKLKICDDPNAALVSMTADDVVSALNEPVIDEPNYADATLQITVNDAMVTLTKNGIEGEEVAFTATEIKDAASGLVPAGYELKNASFSDITVACGENDSVHFTAEKIAKQNTITSIVKAITSAIKSVFGWLFR